LVFGSISLKDRMVEFVGSGISRSAFSRSRPAGTVNVIGAAAGAPPAGTGRLGSGAPTGSVIALPSCVAAPSDRYVPVT